MSLDDLIPINEALLLEKTQFHKIIKEFMAHSSYCGSTFLPEKMSDWCSYLQCDGLTCKNEIILEAMGKITSPTVIQNNCNFSINSSRDPLLNFNGSCFDNFFCTPDWASKDYHYVLGIFGIILAIFSLIFSIIYLTGFHREFGKKNTRALLLIAHSICDIIFILFTIISSFSIYSFYSTLIDQLKIYSSLHIYFVQYLLPIASLFESMSIWILILLIFDRFNYLHHGTHSKNLLTNKVCFILLGSVFISLVAFSALKPFMYEIEKLPINHDFYRLKYSNIGKSENYQNLVRFWLKMPMESLLPLTTVFIFIVMVCHKLIFASSINSKRNNTEIDLQEFRLTKSILYICCLLLLVKVPKMAFHILKYEIGISNDMEIKFYLFTEFFDQIYYLIKVSFLYQYMCPIFSNYLQNLFCCEKEFRMSSSSKFKNYDIECEEDDKEFLYEIKCKELLYKATNIDKETIV